MTEISVKHLKEDTYKVDVTEDNELTTHEVRAIPAVVKRYGGTASPEILIERSFKFLLDREPASMILRSFDLPVIERYFPDYPQVIRELLK